jgi:hypothetical protein
VVSIGFFAGSHGCSQSLNYLSRLSFPLFLLTANTTLDNFSFSLTFHQWSSCVFFSYCGFCVMPHILQRFVSLAHFERFFFFPYLLSRYGFDHHKKRKCLNLETILNKFIENINQYQETAKFLKKK